MPPVTTAEPGADLEPWQEFDPGPDPGDRGIGQDGQVYIWSAAYGWQPEPEPEMEAGS